MERVSESFVRWNGRKEDDNVSWEKKLKRVSGVKQRGEGSVSTGRNRGCKEKTVFQPLLKDNLMAKRLDRSFITDFFKEYLIDNSLDDLISILKRGREERRARRGRHRRNQLARLTR